VDEVPAGAARAVAAVAADSVADAVEAGKLY
jgi:hypothetical protein